MSRLRRLELHRFVGLRGTGVVFDTDDANQLAALVERAAGGDPVAVLPIVTFAPDSLVEAANRGYRPLKITDHR
jgi:hypothetical protein